MKRLSCILTEEEDSSKLLTNFIVRRSWKKKKLKSTGRDSRRFAQEKTSDSYDKKHSCKHRCIWSSWQLACLLFAVFFSKTNERTSSQIQCPVFQKRHIGERILTVWEKRNFITKPQLKSYLQSTCCYKRSNSTIHLQILKNRSNSNIHKRRGNRYN